MNGIDELLAEVGAKPSSNSRSSGGFSGIDALLREATGGKVPEPRQKGRPPEEVNPPIAPTSFAREVVRNTPELFVEGAKDLGRQIIPSLTEGYRGMKAIAGIPGEVSQSLTEPGFRQELIQGLPGTVADIGKEAGVKTLQAAAGATKGITLGAVDPTQGTVGVPFTSIKKKVQPTLKEALIDLGVEPELAESKVAETGGEMAGSLVPWVRISKVIGGVAKAAKASLGSKVLAPQAAAKTEQFLQTLFGTSAAQKAVAAGGRIAQEGATGAAVGAAQVRDEGESAIENAAHTAALGAVFAGGVEGVGLAASYLKAKEVKRFYDNLAEIFYETKATDPATANAMARQVTEKIVRQGGIDNISRATIRKSREALDDVIAGIKERKPAPAAARTAEPPKNDGITNLLEEVGVRPKPTELTPGPTATPPVRTLPVPEQSAPAAMGRVLPEATAPAPSPEIAPKPAISPVEPPTTPITQPAITPTPQAMPTPEVRPTIPSAKYEAVEAKPGEMKTLPIEKPGSKEGPARALFSYYDPEDPRTGVKLMFNVWGDQADPLVRLAGYGSSIPFETVKKMGIPITGREPRQSGQDYQAALQRHETVKAKELELETGQPKAATSPETPAAISPEQQRARDIFQSMPKGGEPKPPTENVPREMPEPMSAAPAEGRTMPEAEVQGRASRWERTGRERQPIPSEGPTPEKIIRRKEIAKNIADKLNIPVRIGRFRAGKSVLGIFKIKPEVIRLREANDIETLTHEAGHYIDKDMGFRKELPAYAKELKPIATKPHGKGSHLAEGFAEFVRMYVTDVEKAQKAAPGFFKFFEERILIEEPELLNVLKQARQDYDRWLKQPSAARILAHINQVSEAAKAITWDDMYTALIDDLHPLKVVRDKLIGDQPLDVKKDPYLLARLTRGWMGKAEVFLKHGTFGFDDYELKSKSLQKILGPLEDRLDEFRIYLTARRSLELSDRGIVTGIDPKDALHEVSRLEKDFKSAAEDLDKYQDALLRYLVDSGALSERAYQHMKVLNKAYVPFYRAVQDTGDVGASAGGKKFADLFSPVGRVKGSTEEIVDPLESIIKNTYAFIQMAEHNAVGRALVDLAEKTEGAGKFVEKLPPKMMATTVEIADIKRQLENLGVTVPDEAVEEMITTFRPNTAPEKGSNVISVLREGKRQYFEVTPELYKAMEGLNQESLGLAVKILSIPAKTLRIGATMTPEFSLRNPFRDQPTAYVFSKYGYKPFLDLGVGISHMLKADDVFVKWMQSGGGRATFTALDRPEVRKTLESLFNDDPRFGRFMYALKHPLNSLLAVLEAGEEATRIGEFGRAIKKEGTSKEGILRGGYAGREVTVDFGRGGSRTKGYKAQTAFFGPFVQGTDKLVREASDKKSAKKFWINGTIGLTLPTLYLWWQNHDEEWYREKPDWEKNSFWFLNKTTRLPKPPGLSLPFCNIPERFLDYAFGVNPEIVKPMLKTISDSLMFNFIPTYAVALLENWANKSWYFDTAIVPPNKAGLLPEYQVKPHTAQTAVALGKILGYSPAKVENVVRGYAGGLGKYALDIIDAAGEAAKFFPEKPEVYKGFMESTPGLRGLYSRYPSMSSASIERFYDGLNETRKVANTVGHFFKQGQVDVGKKVLSKHRQLFQAAAVYEQGSKIIGLKQNMIRSIATDPNSPYAPKDSTPQERRTLIDRLTLDAVDIAKRFNQIAEPIIKKAENDETLAVAEK